MKYQKSVWNLRRSDERGCSEMQWAKQAIPGIFAMIEKISLGLRNFRSHSESGVKPVE